jgi:fumarate hydratase class I
VLHLDGTGPAVLTPPMLEDWPDVTWEVSESAKRANLDTLSPEEVQRLTTQSGTARPFMR